MRITVSDYPDQQGPDQDLARLKADVAKALQVAPEEVELRAETGGLVAAAKGKEKVEIAFADAKDELRLLSKVKSDAALPAVDLKLGDAKDPVLIPQLPADDPAAVRAIKAALVARLGVPVVDIRVKLEKGTLWAFTEGKQVALAFATPDQEKRAIELAKKGRSDHLADFGKQPSDVVLKTGPYQGLSDAAMVKAFQRDVETQLGVKLDEVRFELKDGEIRLIPVENSKWGLMADRFLSPVRDQDGFDVSFANRADYVRLLKVAAQSKSPVVAHLGKRPSQHVVPIPAYPAGLTRDEAIARFKDDLSRALGASPEEIEVHYSAGLMEAKVKGKNRVYDITFKHADDFERFSRWAIESRSTRLVDFGKKMVETRITGTATTGYPDPLGKLKLSQGIITEFYMGDAAQHLWKVGANTYQVPFGGKPFELESALLGYHHAFWGGLDVRVTPEGKLSLSNVESNFASGKWETYWGDVKSLDGEAIGQGLGVLGGAALGLYAFSRLWPNEEKLAIPLSVKVYDNGFMSVGTLTHADLMLGNKTFDLNFNKLGLNFRENIRSGVSTTQTVAFSVPDKVLNYGAAIQYDRFAGSFAQGADVDDGKLTGTQLVLSQGIPFSDKWVGLVGVQQAFDGKWKPINPGMNLGINYQLNETWGFSASTGITAPDYKSGPSVTGTLGVGLYL